MRAVFRVVLLVVHYTHDSGFRAPDPGRSMQPAVSEWTDTRSAEEAALQFPSARGSRQRRLHGFDSRALA